MLYASTTTSCSFFGVSSVFPARNVHAVATTKRSCFLSDCCGEVEMVARRDDGRCAQTGMDH
jgi:hypothetical protein